MTDRVLPSLGGRAIVRKLPLYPLVDLLHGKGLSGGALQRHKYHAREREWWLVRVFPVVALVSHAQNDVEHLLRRVAGLASDELGVVFGLLPVAVALGLPSGPGSHGTDAVGRASQSVAHRAEDSRRV